jgi:hypothetical protein
MKVVDFNARPAAYFFDGDNDAPTLLAYLGKYGRFYHIDVPEESINAPGHIIGRLFDGYDGKFFHDCPSFGYCVKLGNSQVLS